MIASIHDYMYASVSIFIIIKEQGMVKNLMVRMDDDLHKKLKAFCVENDLSIKQQIMNSVMELFSGKKEDIKMEEENIKHLSDCLSPLYNDAPFNQDDSEKMIAKSIVMNRKVMSGFKDTQYKDVTFTEEATKYWNDFQNTLEEKKEDGAYKYAAEDILNLAICCTEDLDTHEITLGGIKYGCDLIMYLRSNGY